MEARPTQSSSSEKSRKKAKPLTKDALSQKCHELATKLNQLKQYDNHETKSIQEAVSQFYWDYPTMRQDCADWLTTEGYAAVSVKMLKNLNEIGIFKSDLVWFPTYYSYNALWNYSSASSTFSKLLAESGIMSLLVANVGHSPYLEAMDSANVCHVLKASMALLSNLARVYEVRYLFKEFKVHEVLKYFERSSDDFFRVHCLLILAYTSEESQNEKLLTDTDYISYLSSALKKGLEDTENRAFHGASVACIAGALNRLSVNQENKLQLVENGVHESYAAMMQSPSLVEQKLAAQGVWLLSFCEDARRKIHNNAACLKGLHKLEAAKDKDIKKLVIGSLAMINKDLDKEQGNATKEAKVVQNGHEMSDGESAVTGLTKEFFGHIMISYSWANQPAVLQISNALKAAGYNVWIDVDKIEGDTLQAMAEAVENSALVLICVSAPYKESPNTRTEAEYAFKQKKSFIPCMMQKKYTPDGWLGALLGSKFYYDFASKEPFEKTIKKLMKEIGDRGKDVTVSKAGKTLSSTNFDKMVEQENRVSPQHWNKDEVYSWLINNGLKRCAKTLTDYDGSLLVQLVKLKQEAPEFFYQYLDNKFEWNMMEILKFTQALENLHIM